MFVYYPSTTNESHGVILFFESKALDNLFYEKLLSTPPCVDTESKNILFLIFTPTRYGFR